MGNVGVYLMLHYWILVDRNRFRKNTLSIKYFNRIPRIKFRKRKFSNRGFCLLYFPFTFIIKRPSPIWFSLGEFKNREFKNAITQNPASGVACMLFRDVRGVKGMIIKVKYSQTQNTGVSTLFTVVLLARSRCTPRFPKRALQEVEGIYISVDVD